MILTAIADHLIFHLTFPYDHLDEADKYACEMDVIARLKRTKEYQWHDVRPVNGTKTKPITKQSFYIKGLPMKNSSIQHSFPLTIVDVHSEKYNKLVIFKSYLASHHGISKHLERDFSGHILIDTLFTNGKSPTA